MHATAFRDVTALIFRSPTYSTHMEIASRMRAAHDTYAYARYLVYIQNHVVSHLPNHRQCITLTATLVHK